MTRRYPATASPEELERYIKLEGDVVPEDRCVEAALAVAGPALKPRKSMLRWAWLAGLPVAAALIVFPGQLPLDMSSFFAVIFCFAALWVRGVQFEPFSHALDARRSVTWRSFMSTEVFVESRAPIQQDDARFRVSSAARTADQMQLLALNSLNGLPSVIREKIAVLRREANELVDENLPDSFVHLGNVVVVIAVCGIAAFANTRSNDWRVVSTVLRMIVGLSVGWSLSSALASGRERLKERWRRRVLEEQLIFAACGGVPDNVLTELAATKSALRDLEFATVSEHASGRDQVQGSSRRTSRS